MTQTTKLDRARTPGSPLLGVLGLVAAAGTFALGIRAAVLEASDSGTSFGPQFNVAAQAVGVAFIALVVALSLSGAAVGLRRGRVFGGIGIALALIAAPVGIVVMDALPAALP